ncbi:MAG: hypothetical protein QOE13_1584 [Gaiellaceae bacterium]|jgi:hypothetical protein|nr:hypothetical protein [Gaiellaceae bacterium]
MNLVTSTRARSAAAILLMVALITAAALTATGRAGSVRTSVSVQIAPHVLTAGERGVIAIQFVNNGPSTVTHVLATVTARTTSGLGPLPLPASAFSGFALPKGCSVIGSTSTVLKCDIGHLGPGTARQVISFTAPATATPFFAHVTVSFDEGKNTGLTDTVAGEDPFPFSLASGADTKGQCTVLGSTLTAGDATQQTSLTYNALPSTLLPCTPVSAGVDSVRRPSNVPHAFPKISFVDFFDGAGLATVKVDILSPPEGVTDHNLALYELARFPIDLTATNNGAPVPNCVDVGGTLQIPAGSGFLSCIVSVETLHSGGLRATLLAKGGEDGGWGGIG